VDRTGKLGTLLPVGEVGAVEEGEIKVASCNVHGSPVAGGALATLARRGVATKI